MSAFEQYFSQFTACCRKSRYYDDILRMFHTYRTILLHTGKLEFKLRTNEERDPEAIQAIREYVDEVTDSFTFFFDRANDWEPKLRSLKGFVRRSVTCEREFDMRGMNFETAAFLPIPMYFVIGKAIFQLGLDNFDINVVENHQLAVRYTSLSWCPYPHQGNPGHVSITVGNGELSIRDAYNNVQIVPLVNTRLLKLGGDWGIRINQDEPFACPNENNVQKLLALSLAPEDVFDEFPIFRTGDLLRRRDFLQSARSQIICATVDNDVVAVKVSKLAAQTFAEYQRLKLIQSDRILHSRGIAYLPQGVGLVTRFMKNGSLDRAIRPTCMRCIPTDYFPHTAAEDFNLPFGNDANHLFRILPLTSGDWWCYECRQLLCGMCYHRHDRETHTLIPSDIYYDNGDVPEVCRPLFHRRNWVLVRRVLGDVARAMRHVHEEGWMHRDLKSSNILLDENFHAYLSDFEFVQRVPDDGAYVSPAGTPGWMAPEVMTGNSCKMSDVWSFGVLIWELVVGSVPLNACLRCCRENTLSEAIFQCLICNERLCDLHREAHRHGCEGAVKLQATKKFVTHVGGKPCTECCVAKQFRTMGSITITSNCSHGGDDPVWDNDESRILGFLVPDQMPCLAEAPENRPTFQVLCDAIN
eukprot:Rmarinus@m.11120